MKGKHAQKKLGAVGAMAPNPPSLETRGGGGCAYKDRARPSPRGLQPIQLQAREKAQTKDVRTFGKSATRNTHHRCFPPMGVCFPCEGNRHPSGGRREAAGCLAPSSRRPARVREGAAQEVRCPIRLLRGVHLPRRGVGQKQRKNPNSPVCREHSSHRIPLGHRGKWIENSVRFAQRGHSARFVMRPCNSLAGGKSTSICALRLPTRWAAVRVLLDRYCGR